MKKKKIENKKWRSESNAFDSIQRFAPDANIERMYLEQ